MYPNKSEFCHDHGYTLPCPLCRIKELESRLADAEGELAKVRKQKGSGEPWYSSECKYEGRRK